MSLICGVAAWMSLLLVILVTVFLYVLGISEGHDDVVGGVCLSVLMFMGVMVFVFWLSRLGATKQAAPAGVEVGIDVC